MRTDNYGAIQLGDRVPRKLSVVGVCIYIQKCKQRKSLTSKYTGVMISESKSSLLS